MAVFLAASDSFQFSQILIPLVVISMSMAIPIVAIIAEHLQKVERMRLIQKAIEHGTDPASLQLEEPGPKSRRRRLPYRGGMVLIAIGLALSFGTRVSDFYVGNIEFPFATGGYICLAIGVALLLNDFINRSRFND